MDHRALVMTRVALILGVPFLLWELGSYPRGLCMGSVAALRGKPVLMIQGSVGSAPKSLFPIYREWYSLSIRRRGGLARPGTDNWYASGHGAATMPICAKPSVGSPVIGAGLDTAASTSCCAGKGSR